MRKDFRDFVLKGNLLQPAVAFIMDAAFGAVVKSFISDQGMSVLHDGDPHRCNALSELHFRTGLC